MGYPMKKLMLVSLLLLNGCSAMFVQPNEGLAVSSDVPRNVDRDVAPVLVSLLDERKLQKPSPSDYQNTALKDLIALTTPAGYRLKNRFLALGVSLSQALPYSPDTQLRNRLLEAARWTSSPRVRSEALLSLAQLRDPGHLKYFREALLDSSVAVQFAAVEALQVWGYAEAVPLLIAAANQSPSPLIRVFAAQAALRLGDPQGREILIQFLRDTNWVKRALAARYLGDLGLPSDAELIISRIGPERENKFVVAELCIAGLKLSPKKPTTVLVQPVPAPATPPPPPKPKASSAFELEPLVVTAPRLRLAGAQFVDVRIDNDLVRLLEQMASEPLPDEFTVPPELSDINSLITPAGFNLKVRYSDIIFLLIDGLAGTRNFSLVQRLEDMSHNNPNPRVRAAALIALSFDKSRMDLTIYREALRDTNAVVRFAVVESLTNLGGVSVRTPLMDVVQMDASPTLRIFAAQALLRVGDRYGQEVLVRALDDPDYVIRAMAVLFLGELGTQDNYYRVAARLTNESNNFVLAETCLAMMRLAQ